MRAGRYVQQSRGYRAFIPEDLPPKPELHWDAALTKLLSDADRALGRLDGVASILPNPNLFVAMYVKHEAVLSSQIEGTQSTLEDLLEYEAAGRIPQAPGCDVEEVVNYVAAMNQGLERLSSLPLSLRLLREIHERLLEGVRGSARSPGEFRTSQNWIGPAGCTLETAQFVPPPPHEMRQALDALEKFLHERDDFPELIHCGLAHAQFETIHPFLDGNGRVGRLLITLLLCERQVLQRPLLYLSYYFKAHRAQYYDRLMAIREDGDWEGWLKFFLRGVFQVSQAATEVSRAIMQLREKDRGIISSHGATAANGLKLLDHLFQHPLIQVRDAEKLLECSYATANSLVRFFEQLNILKEITGQQRNRIYRYDAYYKLFSQQALTLPAAAAQAERPGQLEP
ncbi:MAG: Fic family protein [Candidatus Hydrogenedentes bacterium]|nr:Fic family protein [Candidatus Hydrogenedentota bacterium]